MKNILFFSFALLLTNIAFSQTGKAVTTNGKNYRETTVSIEINSSSEKVWQILTNDENYTKWNSTIISLNGKIELGNKIKLISKLAPNRTFKLVIKEFDVNKKLVWGDKKGNRTYTISQIGNGKILFTMSERIGGFMFNMYADKIPSFDESFEQFANDLKIESEKL